MTQTNGPYSFVGVDGRVIDWSGFVGVIAPVISNHNKPISKDELAVLVGRKQRECNLVKSILAMQNAGEHAECRMIVRQMVIGKLGK